MQCFAPHQRWRLSVVTHTARTVLRGYAMNLFGPPEVIETEVFAAVPQALRKTHTPAERITAGGGAVAAGSFGYRRTESSRSSPSTRASRTTCADTRTVVSLSPITRSG